MEWHTRIWSRGLLISKDMAVFRELFRGARTLCLATQFVDSIIQPSDGATPVVATLILCLALMYSKMHYSTSILSIIMIALLGTTVGMSAKIMPQWISSSPLFVESRLGYSFYLQVASLVLSLGVVSLSLFRGK